MEANPATGDWNTASNWSPMTVPNAPSDTATFATSNQTNVSISADTEVSSIVFTPGASAFTIRILPEGIGGSLGNVLDISGGIINNAGSIQNFVLKGSRSSGMPELEFLGSATAGNATAFTVTNATINFYDTSSAGEGIFTANPATGLNAQGGVIEFLDGSNAGNATFVLNGSVGNARPGSGDHFQLPPRRHC